VIFILKLVLSKNSQGYKILLNELWETAEFSGLQQQPVAASSIHEARQKMPETIFTLINLKILFLREESNPLLLWRNHSVFGIDGSKINVPHKLIGAGYKAPNKQQYYPQGIMSPLDNGQKQSLDLEPPIQGHYYFFSCTAREEEQDDKPEQKRKHECTIL
jgi:hypothetical protein